MNDDAPSNCIAVGSSEPIASTISPIGGECRVARVEQPEGGGNPLRHAAAISAVSGSTLKDALGRC
jgi:hypothetical protein